MIKSQFITQVKREYWEHRGAFLFVPLVTLGVFAALLTLTWLSLDSMPVDVSYYSESHDEYGSHSTGVDLSESSLMDVFGLKLQELSALPESKRQEVITRVLMGSSMLWFVPMFFVVFFYLLDCLYQERRDRSVLFWKSMPVSDGLTVLAKLTAATVVAPLIYFACAAGAQLLLLTSATLAATGSNVDTWQTLWVSSNLLVLWLHLVAFHLFAVLWLLPFYGWVLLVSSWARSVPFFWAIGIPVVVILVDHIIPGPNWVSDFVSQHVFPKDINQSVGTIMDQGMNLAISIDLAVAMAVGAALVFAASWQRGRADEL